MNKALLFQLTLAFLTLLFTGCTSSLHLAVAREHPRFDGGVRPVFVTNPEQQPEYQILQSSGIYRLSAERDGARFLTLHPMGHFARCGNPLMLTFFTLGIVPGSLSAHRMFSYDLETDGVTETRLHIVPLYERFSIWEWLAARSDQHNQKIISKALARSSLMSRASKPTN